jgi:hypothetical protein
MTDRFGPSGQYWKRRANAPSSKMLFSKLVRVRYGTASAVPIYHYFVYYVAACMICCRNKSCVFSDLLICSNAGIVDECSKLLFGLSELIFLSGLLVPCLLLHPADGHWSGLLRQPVPAVVAGRLRRHLDPSGPAPAE